MSPRKPAVLRGGGENLREYLIATAARLIGERGSAGLAVRDIAREAQVADGALYNYFEDKEDLLAQALLAHVGSVMSGAPRMPPPGAGTVAENLEMFIDGGLAVLSRVAPAFAGLQSQPGVLSRFHAMVGGNAAFGVAGPDPDEDGAEGGGLAAGGDADADRDAGPRGLPDILRGYLSSEQRIGRIDAAADVEAATMVIVGAIHGQVLPQVMLSTPGSPITTPPGFAARLARTVLAGIAPGPPGR